MGARVQRLACAMGFWRSSRVQNDPPAALEPAGNETHARRSLWRRLPIKYRALFLLLGLGIVTAGGVVSAAFVHYTIKFPDPMAIRREASTMSVRVLANDGTMISERGQAHEFVPLDLLPQHVIDAVIATEDRRFYDHSGLDPLGLLRAAFANMRAGRYAQGGSTISQQLAKNLFLSPERTLWRKAEELLLALWLEVRMSKAEILELYLNRVYFGGGAYGIDAAAHRYFGKPSAQLKLAEAAVLAGLLKAPSKYSPNSSPGLARSRARVVLKSMLAAGFIGEEAELAAAGDLVRFLEAIPGRDGTGLDYAIDFVLERMPPLIGTNHREIIVETTIDADLQKRAQAAVEEMLGSEGAKMSAGQAAVVVLDREGGIRAMVGGRSWAQSQFNRAVKARRQPGSAFKPLVYLAAVERGARPETTIVDAPITIGDWSPRNEDGRHRGSMSLRQALAHSVNTVAVRLQQDTGTQRVVSLARRLGIKSDLRQDLSLALGTSEVSLLELTGGYAVLANGGNRVGPHVIRKVRTGATIVYQRAETLPQQIVAAEHVGIMNSMLNSALVSGTGRRAALPRHIAAGKTGTSQDFRDAWFLGYTAHFAAGVWVGNDTGEPMNRVMGGGLPAAIWKAVMQAAHERLPPIDLPGTMQDAPASMSETAPLVGAQRDSADVGAARNSIRAPAMRSIDGSSPAATASGPPLAPRASIDAGLFLDALSENAAPREPSAAVPVIDFGGLTRTLGQWSLPRMMGVGVNPLRETNVQANGLRQ